MSKAQPLSGSEGKSWYAALVAQAYEFAKPSLRWLYSTNAKDIGTMYLAYSLFTGLIGLAFSVLLRMELSSPGNQYLAGNHHLYNVVVTTHGIVGLPLLKETPLFSSSDRTPLKLTGTNAPPSQ